jgi:DNA-binding CsgD family transcriptional regulator
MNAPKRNPLFVCSSCGHPDIHHDPLLGCAWCRRTEKPCRAMCVRLTEREIDVALVIIQGASDKGAADILNISVRTVGAHKYNIFQKCRVHSVIELLIFFLKRRIVTVESLPNLSGVEIDQTPAVPPKMLEGGPAEEFEPVNVAGEWQ